VGSLWAVLTGQGNGTAPSRINEAVNTPMNIRRMLQSVTDLSTAVFHLSAKLQEGKKEGRGKLGPEETEAILGKGR